MFLACIKSLKKTIYENNFFNIDVYLEKIEEKKFDYYLKIENKHLKKFFEKK